MNTELITKLAKLANNNPNENEANLAARKVCRLLAEGEFKFSSNTTAPVREPIIRSSSNPTNSVTEDFFKKYYQPHKKQWDFYRSAMDDDYIDWDKAEPKSEKPKKDIPCSKCGKATNTAFVGPPQVYVCYTCIWEEYKGKPEAFK